MTSIDTRSLYSTSTLVGGDDDDEEYATNGREDPLNDIDQDDDDEEAIRQMGAYRIEPLINNIHAANRDNLLSRQSSVTTLYAQPTSGPSTRRPPRAAATAAVTRPLAPLASLSFSQPLIVPQQEGNLEAHDGLRIPWWSTMMPTPVMNRRKSSGRITTTGTSNGSSSQDYSQSSFHSTSSPSSSQAASTGIHCTPNNSLSSQNISQSTIPIPPPLPSDYPLYAKCYCEENAYLLAAYLSRTCQQWNQHEIATLKDTFIRWDVDVVVVSNKNQTVALWQQRAGQSASDGYQVVWDYHVFVIVSCQKKLRVVRGRDSTASASRQNRQLFTRATSSDNATRSGDATTSWVYDLDSRLVNPIPLTSYLSATFGIDNGAIATLNKRLHPLFRVMSANDYFIRFGSDRSHMKVSSNTPARGETFEWLQPRPEWDLILGRKASHSSDYFFDSFVEMRVRLGDGRFGTIVKLEDLYNSQGLMSSNDEYQDTMLAAGVAVLLGRIGERSNSINRDVQEMSQSPTWLDTISLEEDEIERTPGILIGGVLRLGLRPPPPPPDGAVIASNRGKRIMDPLYPAYILSAYEHRMGEDEAQLSTL